MRPPDLEVEIDELVLHGIEIRSREGIADAIRSELAATLADWNPTAHADVAHLDGGSFPLPPLASVDAVGKSVARQIELSLRGGVTSLDSTHRDSATGATGWNVPPNTRDGDR
jgi:hypothetical protein